MKFERFKRRTLEQFFIALALAFLATYTYVKFVPYGLSWNITASIPKGIYFSTEYANEPLKRHQIACFGYHAPVWAMSRHYFPDNFQLCKYAYGLPGDRVDVNGDRVTVRSQDGDAEGGTYRGVDSLGRVLPRSSNLAGSVPSGEYVMLAPEHSNSLDSRYLGRVRQTEITRTLIPIFTW